MTTNVVDNNGSDNDDDADDDNYNNTNDDNYVDHGNNQIMMKKTIKPYKVSHWCFPYVYSLQNHLDAERATTVASKPNATK